MAGPPGVGIVEAGMEVDRGMCDDRYRRKRPDSPFSFGLPCAVF